MLTIYVVEESGKSWDGSEAANTPAGVRLMSLGDGLAKTMNLYLDMKNLDMVDKYKSC